MLLYVLAILLEPMKTTECAIYVQVFWMLYVDYLLFDRIFVFKFTRGMAHAGREPTRSSSGRACIKLEPELTSPSQLEYADEPQSQTQIEPTLRSV
jgi:hypothetical protein